MKTPYILLLLFALATGIFAQAQTFNSGTTELTLEDYKAVTSGQNAATQGAVPTAVTTGNTVFIDQIGEGNTAVLQTTSNSSEINILQNGSQNNLFSRIAADNIQHAVVQNGDNNLFVHSNPFRLETHNSQVIQNGNNQNLEWFGTNSISENMKVNMQGEGQTVIVRSFN